MDNPNNSFDLIQYVPETLVFLGGVVVASIGALVTRWNAKDTTTAATKQAATETEQAGRRDTIADRDALIETLSSRMDELQGRVDTMETEIQEVRTHNFSLVQYIIRCIAVFQKHGLESEIPKPLPKGVDI